MHLQLYFHTTAGKQPPPVPARKSVRRSTTSTNHSRSPTPESDIKPQQPPPVVPRTKSLKRTTETTGSVHSDSKSDDCKQCSNVSPAVELQLPSNVNCIGEEPITTIPPKPAPRKTQPQPKPRTPIASRKTPSENFTSQTFSQDISSSTELPRIPPKKSVSSKQPVIPPSDIVFELENVPMSSPATSVFEMNTESTPMIVSILPFVTPLPPDCNPVLTESSSTDNSEHAYIPSLSPKNPAIPSIPETVPVVSLPPKNPGPPSFTPPPPSESPVTISPLHTPCFQPDLEPPLPDFSPPPPPARVSSLPTGNTPTLEKAVSTLTDEQVNGFPPLPPKESITPPPPPPITEYNFPLESPHECYSDSESEDEGPLMSIQSCRATGDDQLGLQVAPKNSASSSSEEGSPFHQPIRQQLGGLKSGANAVESDSKMMITSSVIDERDDYMNQQVIDQVMENDEDQDEVRVGQPLTVKGSRGALNNDLELRISNGHDYMNSDLVDQVLDEDNDEEEPLGSERLVIRSTLLRQVDGKTDRDYENQEVLEGDIIPLLTVTTNQPESLNWEVSQLGDQYPPGAPTAGLSIYDTLENRVNTDAPVASRVKNNGNNQALLGNRDSVSGTFPRTRSDAAYLREYSDGNSSISTTPGSIDSLGMEPNFSQSRGTADFFDGVW